MHGLYDIVLRVRQRRAFGSSADEAHRLDRRCPVLAGLSLVYPQMMRLIALKEILGSPVKLPLKIKGKRVYVE